MLCRSVKFVLTGGPERDVVQPAAVLVEAIGGDRPQRDQRAAHVVDNATEQERQLLTGRRVGVVGDLNENRPTEDALVELSGPLDVTDGEPYMRDGIGGDAHPSHGATAQPGGNPRCAC